MVNKALVKTRKQRYLLPWRQMDRSQPMNGKKEHQHKISTGLSWKQACGTELRALPVPRKRSILGHCFKMTMITELSTSVPVPALTTSQDHHSYALVATHMTDSTQSSCLGKRIFMEQTRDSTSLILLNGITRKTLTYDKEYDWQHGM